MSSSRQKLLVYLLLVLLLICAASLSYVAWENVALNAELLRLRIDYNDVQSKYLALKEKYNQLLLNLTMLNSSYSKLLSELAEAIKYEACILVDKDYYHSLIKDIRNANRSIIVAMYLMIYDSDDPHDWANDLIKELVRAKERRVNVTVFLEYRTHWGYLGENLETYNYLRAHNITVILDNEANTDHMKLVIIDDYVVYVGSYNWTESALYHNHEISIKIISQELAKTLKNVLHSF